MARAPTASARPAGLLYEPDFLTEGEESTLLAGLESFAFAEVRMRGQVAKRTVLHLGLRYDYDGWGLTPADPLPESFLWLRERAASFVEIDPEAFVETLISRYPPGAGIGWHRDAPMFGSKVVGVSLLSPCAMRFQRRRAGIRETHTEDLAPRSVYALTGAARWSWQHSIPSTPGLRYSVTFRTLATGTVTKE